MTSIIRGTRPRPSVGLVGNFLYDENDYFNRLFPTIWRAPALDELEDKVQANELDLIIISREFPDSGNRYSNYFNRVHVISFLEENNNLPGPFGNAYLRIIGESGNEAFELPRLPLAFERRREADLAQIRDIRDWSYIRVSFLGGRKAEDDKRVKEILKESALILDRYEQIPLAVIFKREETGLGVAWLPNTVFDQVKWVELIAMKWVEDDRERFPEFGDWTKSTKWMTPEEEKLVNNIDQLENNKQQTIIEFDQKIASLHSDLASAILASNKGSRRLITAQGAILVDEVAKVFQEFGFEVDNIDEILDPKLPKREDLRLRDPSDDSDWEAIVEVRGYAKSAGKTAEFQRISRFVSFYQGEKGRLPDKRIYVVNGQIDLPPDLRLDVMASSEEDIRVFSEDGGLIVSTLDLFRAMKALNQLGKDKIKE